MVLGAKLRLRQLRHQPMLITIGIPLFDKTASVLRFEVRENKDAADPALLALGNAVSPADGISATLSTVDGQPYTTVEIRAAKATLEAIALPVPFGSDLFAYYGFKIDGVEWFGGDFILGAQANHG